MAEINGIDLHTYHVKMPLMRLPVNMILVQLANARVMISPSTDRSMYPNDITDVVAPNLFHNPGVANAHAVLPHAHLWGVPGFRDKLPDIPWYQELTPDAWPFNQELKVLPIAGMPKFNEAAFYHAQSKSLIVTDLCFNLTQRFGIGGWLVMQGFGTYRRFASSRFFRRFIEDADAFRQSIDALLATDFENLIMAHGEPVVGGARNKLVAALQERKLLGAGA